MSEDNKPAECPYSIDHLFIESENEMENGQKCQIICKAIHASIFLGSYKKFCKFLRKAKCKRDYWNCDHFKKATET